GLDLRQVQENNARLRHFRRDRLVTEVETKTIGRWFADYARQDKGRGQKIQVRQFLSVTRVPKEARAWTAFDVAPSRVHGEGGRAAGDNARHRQALAFQFAAQNLNRGKRGFTSRRSLSHIRVVDVSVIGMQAAGRQGRQCGNQTEEVKRMRVRRDAGSVLDYI